MSNEYAVHSSFVDTVMETKDKTESLTNLKWKVYLSIYLHVCFL